MQSLTIQGHEFQFNAPYEEGHVLNEAEASVLNQTFAENLRNNFAAKIRKATETGQPLPTQEQFLEYANSYSFGIRQAAGPRVDPVVAETNRLAWAAVVAVLKKHGKKQADVTKEAKDKLIEVMIAKHPELAERAKQIVAARSASVVEDIDLSALVA